MTPTTNLEAINGYVAGKDLSYLTCYAQMQSRTAPMTRCRPIRRFFGSAKPRHVQRCRRKSPLWKSFPWYSPVDWTRASLSSRFQGNRSFAGRFLFLKTRDLAGLLHGQLSLAPHFVQKVAEEIFCVPQVGQSFVPGWAVVVGPVHIGPGGGWEILARLE